MASLLQVGRLAIAPPLLWNEQLGDPVTNMGGTPIPALRSALRHAVSLATFAPDGASDTVADRLRIRRQLRSLLNNSLAKLQGGIYVLYSDDPENSGWYVVDQGLLTDLDGSSGLATGAWKLEQVVWMPAGHMRTNREARNIWVKDLRTGLYPRDALRWLQSTDFSVLPAIALNVLPNGVTSIISTLTGQVVLTQPLPTGRDGGACKLCAGLSDLACVSYERPESALNLSDVIVYDRRGLTSQLPETQYENLIPNPSFEYDATGATSPAGGWIANGSVGGTFAVQTGWSLSGAKSLRRTGTTAGVDFPGWTMSTLTIPIVAGQVYSFRAALNILTNTCSGSVLGGIRWYQANGSTIAGPDTNGTPLGAGTTGIQSFTFTNQTAPAGAAYATALIYAIAGGAGQTFDAYLDNVLLVQSATLPTYYDGDYAGAGWAGTPGNAPSLMPPALNLIANPNFEHDAPNAAPAGWANTDSVFCVPGATLTATNLQHQSGSQAMQVVCTAVGNEGAVISIPGVFGPSGANYTVSLWMKGAVGGEAMQMFLGDASGSGDFNASGNFALTNQWAKYTLTWPVSGSRSVVRFAVRTATATALTFYVDNVEVNYGAAAATYNDGDSSGWMWKGTVGNSVSVQFIDPQAFGWEEAYGIDYQWSWRAGLIAADAPVLDNGLCRVRYDASVGLPGIRVDVWNGSAYVEQGKFTFFRLGDATAFDNTWLSASLAECTTERVVMNLTLMNSADTSSRERVYVTMQRGQVGCTVECYPAPKAAGTLADMLIEWTTAQADVNDSVMKIDSQGATPLPGWTPGAAQTGKITATAGSGSAAWANAFFGATTFTGSENWATMLRYSATSTVTAYQTTLGVLQAAASPTTNRTTAAYGTAQNSVDISSTGSAGYVSVDLSFSSTQAQQVLEAESITLGAGTASTVDAGASNGFAATATRTTDANAHVTQATWPNSFVGQYRVFVRVKVSANSASFYAKTGASTGTTVAAINSTSYVWVDLGDIVSNGTTLEIHAWMSGGAGTVSVDRIEAFLTQDRAATAFRYSGARDLGQAVLNDSRQMGALVAR